MGGVRNGGHQVKGEGVVAVGYGLVIGSNGRRRVVLGDALSQLHLCNEGIRHRLQASIGKVLLCFQIGVLVRHRDVVKLSIRNGTLDLRCHLRGGQRTVQNGGDGLFDVLPGIRVHRWHLGRRTLLVVHDALFAVWVDWVEGIAPCLHIVKGGVHRSGVGIAEAVISGSPAVVDGTHLVQCVFIQG